jgi:DNA replication protein DnaC
VERLAEVIAQAQTAVVENADPEAEERERRAEAARRAADERAERVQRYASGEFRLPDEVAERLRAGKLDETDAGRKVRAWISSRTRPPWLCISGGAGVGKTVAGIDLICRSWGRWVRASDLVAAFSAMFGEQHEMQQKYRDTRLLVIDDVGTESDPARMLSALLELLDERPSAASTPTLITTNLTPKQFAERYQNERLMSRFAQLVKWEGVTGPDLRRGKP